MASHPSKQRDIQNIFNQAFLPIIGTATRSTSSLPNIKPFGILPVPPSWRGRLRLSGQQRLSRTSLPNYSAFRPAEENGIATEVGFAVLVVTTH